MNGELPIWTKKLWSLRTLINPEPDHMEIDLTNRCNLNCEWCCSKEERNRTPIDMSLSDYRFNIQKAWDEGWGIVLTGGGEPTCHPNFLDAVDYLFSEFYDNDTNQSQYHIPGIGLVTNGILIGHIEYFIKQIKILEEDNVWIRISQNDRPISYRLLELMKKYPNRIGISIVYNPDKIESINQANSNAEILKPLAKFIRIKERDPLNIPSTRCTPPKCIGRRFVYIVGPNGTQQYCCLARGRDGNPPDFCSDKCTHLLMNEDLKKAWKFNPFT